MIERLTQLLLYLVASALGVAAAFFVATAFLPAGIAENEFEFDSWGDPAQELNDLPPPQPTSGLGEETREIEPSLEEGASLSISAEEEIIAGPGGDLDQDSEQVSRHGSFSYNPQGKRNLFRPFAGIRATPITADRSRDILDDPNLEPLQRYDLSQLQLIGVIWQSNRPRAMIVDPQGERHTVFLEQKMGRNNGYIAVIREGELVVIETLEEDGVSRQQTRVLSLRQ